MRSETQAQRFANDFSGQMRQKILVVVFRYVLDSVATDSAFSTMGKTFKDVPKSFQVMRRMYFLLLVVESEQ